MSKKNLQWQDYIPLFKWGWNLRLKQGVTISSSLEFGV